MDPFNDFGTNNYRPMNRGQKLKAVISEPPVPTKPFRYSMLHGLETATHIRVDRIGKKRAIARKYAGSEVDPDDPSPYADIDLDEIWGVVETPEDVANIKPLARTLRSRQLKVIAHTLMETIETESIRNKKLVRLGDALQMDDPLLQDFDLGELGVEQEVQKEFRDVIQDCVNCNYEYLRQISMVRAKLIKAHEKKKILAKQLAPFPKKVAEK